MEVNKQEIAIQPINKENAVDPNKYPAKDQTGQQNQVTHDAEFNAPVTDRSYFPFSPDMISPETQQIPLLSLNYEGRPELMNLASPLVRPLDFANTPTLLHSFMNVLGGVNQNTIEEL
eukprot:TRINITY_DN9337_c0_g1_i3.p2 TRINITY_DN9337_c0_g1~~TRINITY_DN9337_c0_g1_i3.p2  ORF type:complete len:118 (+),score=40.07 TRINITY_DN9337_c0_g1_i3:362-715(+)